MGVRVVRIATRQSPLAVWQASYVGDRLRQVAPDIRVDYVKLLTKGDKILDQALSRVGGKDLFVKEIEHALLANQAEVAVHSLKDMPTDLPAALWIAAFPPREDPEDALVSTKGYRFATLPRSARVGTCSQRRAAQLLRARPDLQIVPIRGNVATRLKKLAEEGMDATVLALSGLKRLGLEHVATEVLPKELSLPAIGQGILAVEVRRDDVPTHRMIQPLDDKDARAAATAERAFLRRLEGGCQVPIAGHAEVNGPRLTLTGLVASLDGRTVFEGTMRGMGQEAESLGTRLAEDLLDRGADRILKELKDASSSSRRGTTSMPQPDGHRDE